MREFKIYVFKHVHKFMLQTYPHQRGTFTCYENTELGKLVTLALIKTTTEKLRSIEDKDRARQMATIIIKLNSAQVNHSPRLYKLSRLNLDMDDIFKQRLLLWIAAQRNLGSSVRSACINFLEHYGIEEKEYSLATAYKFWQRFGK